MWTRRELPLWLRVALLAALAAFAATEARASPAPDRWTDAEDSDDALQDLQADYGGGGGDSDAKEVEGATVNVELTQFDYADACSALARARWTWLLAGERGSGPEEAAVWEREAALAASARDNVGFMKTFAELREKVPSAPSELVDQVEYALSAGDLLLPELHYLQKLNYSRAVQRALSDLRVPCHEDDAAAAASEDECVMTLPVVRRVLARSGDAAQQLRAWRGAQEALRPLAAAFPAQLALARAAADANTYGVSAPAEEDHAAEDGREGAGAVGAYWERLQDPDEYLELTFARVRQLWEELRPLHRSLVAYVRERLRKAYGDAALATAGPAPAHGEPPPLPAHLTGSLVGDDWSSLADLVFPGSRLRHLDHALRDKGLSGLRLYQAAYDTLNMSLGVEGLPRGALLAQVRWDGECPAQLVLNCSSGLPRVWTCADSGWLQYAEAHEVLTRLAHAYLGAEEDGKALLREVTRYSATHDMLPGVVRLLSLHPDRLLELEVLPDEDEEAEEEEAAPEEDDGGSDAGVERGEATLRLLTALRVLPRLAYMAAADAFRLRLLAAMADADAANSNASAPVDPVALWVQVRREYMLVAPPAGEEQGDAGWLADPALAANVPLLGRFAAEILVFQALEQLASYDPSHPVVATNQDASLGMLMQLGRSRKWAELINDYLNINEIRIQPFLRYFRPLSALLTPAAAAQAPAAEARAAVDLTPPAPPPPAPPSSADPFQLPDPFSSAAAPEPSAYAPESSALTPVADEEEALDAAPPTAPVVPASPSATSDVDQATARTAVLAASLSIFALALAAGALVGGRHVMKKRHYQRNRRPDARATPKPASDNGDVEAAVDPETEPANPSAHS